MKTNPFGKTSKLHLEASRKDEKTILSDVSFTAPFKVMHPFYEKKDRMSVTVLTASAGIMAGDRQELRFHVCEGAQMELTSQAYEKIHPMEEGYASRDTFIQVDENASFYYTPLPTIPFQDCDYRSNLNAELAGDTSRFLFSEVLTCGRAAHGENFRYRRFQNRVTIRQAGKIIYRDNTRYEPGWMNMQGFGMYEGYTHLGNLILCNVPKNAEWIARVREILDGIDGVEGGVSRTAKGDIVVKVLGRSGDRLIDLLHQFLQ